MIAENKQRQYLNFPIDRLEHIESIKLTLCSKCIIIYEDVLHLLFRIDEKIFCARAHNYVWFIDMYLSDLSKTCFIIIISYAFFKDTFSLSDQPVKTI